MNTQLTVSQINIYPVKSCAGISLQRAIIGETGFEYDRQWMIVDKDGHFVNQKQHAKMARIVPTILGDGGLRLEAPGMTTVTVSLDYSGTKREVEVYGMDCYGIDQGEGVSKWLEAYLGQTYYLVVMDPDRKRQVKEKYQADGSEVTSFADSLPFLLTSEESLVDLNSRLDEDVEMDRFRANIVVSGGEAFQEDGWKKVRIGNTHFRVVKACARCGIVNINQETGEEKGDPLGKLEEYRSKPKGIIFGQRCVHVEIGNEVKVGDSIEALEERSEQIDGSDAITKSKLSDWIQSKIIETKQASVDIKALELKFSQEVDFKAGQHFEVRIPGMNVSRKYSATSVAGSSDQIGFGVQLLPGGAVSPKIWELETGDTLEVRGPFGNYFTWDESLANPVVLIGAGSGITPLLSIYNTMCAKGLQEKVTFIMSTKTKEHLMNYGEVQEKVITRFTKEEGRINQEFLEQKIGSEVLGQDPMCYICGPEGFIDDMADFLLEAGISENNIKSERFV